MIRRSPGRARGWAVAAPAVVLTVLAAAAGGCSGGGTAPGTGSEPGPGSGTPGGTATSASPPSGSGSADAARTPSPAGTPEVDPDDPALDVALSRPREDSYYPAHGDPGVDALHYALDLTWDPDSRTLTGVADVVLRATRDADRLRLDLIDPLEVSSVTVDGAAAAYAHGRGHLVVTAPVRRDERYALRVEYAGTPRPVPAPTTRSDYADVGLTITAAGELWTMQEPFGAHTWYPVNDQPADKALYDVTVRAPEDWVGVSNGVLESRRVVDGRTVTQWTLSRPASSYLTTLAVGDFVHTRDRSASGVPIGYWTPRGDEDVLRDLRVTPAALRWAERRLGRYPFDSLGIVVVDSGSGMETQTMITLGGIDPYTTSPEVIVHEIVHHWYGNVVSPSDWRDVWMNEGMTMFLQGAYEAERTGRTVEQVMDEWAAQEGDMRAASGPPGAYDRDAFAEGNVYYSPALMWNELRKRLGPDAFWSMVRAWPAAFPDGNPTRRQYLRWLERETGRELSAFLDAWLLGTTTPARRR